MLRREPEPSIFRRMIQGTQFFAMLLRLAGLLLARPLLRLAR